MIKDELGNEFFYWPIVNLVEGQNSEVLIITIDTPVVAYLRASQDDRTRVWAKWNAFPANPFIEISQGQGINLSGIAGPTAQFQIYVEALAPIDNAFERVPLTLIASTSSPAGWLT